MAEEILSKDRLEKFEPPLPVIPDAFVLLIGLLVFLFHSVGGFGRVTSQHSFWIMLNGDSAEKPLTTKNLDREGAPKSVENAL
jgi:hypothetical protein